MKPLDGIVVLDLTRFVAGPYCTLLLAGLGAEVVRVEPPGGDPDRARGPFGGPAGAGRTRQTDDDMGLSVLHRWRGKKSITLNLRSAAGVELFLRLTGRADVVVENFLPGTLEKIGIGFPALEAANPRVILCSISGFGQGGPYREWRAFDPIIQGMSGISSLTGYPDRPPVRCGAAVSDTAASLYGVIGILSALRARERTGNGEWVDVSMLDGSFFLLAELFEYLSAGVPLERRGNTHPGTTPLDVYRARDGWISLCVVAPDEWRRVLGALGRPDLASDPRFEASIANRLAHREEVDALVQGWIAQHTVAEAVGIFQAHHVAAGPVLDLSQAVDDPHLREREMVVPLEHPTRGPVPGVIGGGMPVKFLRHPTAFDAPAPALGAHNAEVYGRVGVTPAELEKLAADGVI